MDNEAIETILSAVGRPHVLKFDSEGDFQAVALPQGYTVRDLRKDGMLPPPAHVQQRVTLHTPADFCQYVNRFKGSTTTIFADELGATFEAVLDYHDQGNLEFPRRECAHVARYSCPLSEQWQTWLKHNGRAMPQVDFARFIEDNLPDISDPPAATMLEVALQLEVKKGAKFDSELNLDNGQRSLKYVEEIRGATRSGSLPIPREFQISVPIIYNGPPYSIPARLRYRMSEGTLSIWYELVRPQDRAREAVADVTTSLSAELPAVYLVRGVRGG